MSDKQVVEGIPSKPSQYTPEQEEMLRASQGKVKDILLKTTNPSGANMVGLVIAKLVGEAVAANLIQPSDVPIVFEAVTISSNNAAEMIEKEQPGTFKPPANSN